MALVAKAIRSGVYNDLGSGSNVDLCVITAAGATYHRNIEFLQGKTYTRQFPVRYAPGTTSAPPGMHTRLAGGPLRFG